MKIDLLGFVPSTSGTPQLVLWNNTRADPSVVTGDFFQTSVTISRRENCFVIALQYVAEHERHSAHKFVSFRTLTVMLWWISMETACRVRVPKHLMHHSPL